MSYAPIENIFEELTGFRCFGCSSGNPLTLGLIAVPQGHQVVTTFKPTENHTGFPGMLHGGIQFTLLDDTAFWALLLHTKSMALTNSSSVKYLKPLFVNEIVSCRAEIISQEGKKVTAKSILLNTKGESCTEATFHFTLIPLEVMEKMLKFKFSDKFREKLALLPHLEKPKL